MTQNGSKSCPEPSKFRETGPNTLTRPRCRLKNIFWRPPTPPMTPTCLNIHFQGLSAYTTHTPPYLLPTRSYLSKTGKDAPKALSFRSRGVRPSASLMAVNAAEEHHIRQERGECCGILPFACVALKGLLVIRIFGYSESNQKKVSGVDKPIRSRRPK